MDPPNQALLPRQCSQTWSFFFSSSKLCITMQSAVKERKSCLRFTVWSIVCLCAGAGWGDTRHFLSWYIMYCVPWRGEAWWIVDPFFMLIDRNTTSASPGFYTSGWRSIHVEIKAAWRELGKTWQLSSLPQAPTIHSCTRHGWVAASRPDLPCRPISGTQTRSKLFNSAWMHRMEKEGLFSLLMLPGLLRYGHSCYTTLSLFNFQKQTCTLNWWVVWQPTSSSTQVKPLSRTWEMHKPLKSFSSPLFTQLIFILIKGAKSRSGNNSWKTNNCSQVIGNTAWDRDVTRTEYNTAIPGYCSDPGSLWS